MKVQRGLDLVDSILCDFALGELTGRSEKDVLERYLRGKILVDEAELREMARRELWQEEEHDAIEIIRMVLGDE